ncbi:MAG: hypothetical protein J6P73_05810 [Bacteroidales bacterium]|nr:hypothetical protein [Bacteroidales bacterium]
MKRLSLIVICLMAGIWSAFAQVGMEFGTVESSKTNRFVDFKLMKEGKKVPYYGLLSDDCVCYELVNGDTVEIRIDSLVDISNKKLVSNNLTIVILADQGMILSEADYMKLKEAIVSFVDALPEYVKVYIAMMGTDVTETERVYAGESIRSYVRRDNMAEQSEEEKSIYASIISKIQEIGNLDEDDCFYPDVLHNRELSSDTLSDKMLFILSGKVEQDEDENFFRDKLLFNNPDYLEIPEKLKAIYCVYFGDELDRVMENEFKFMCHRTPEGRFYSHFAVDSVKNVLLGAIDSIAMDYRMYYSVGEKVTYNGQPLMLNLDIKKAKAHGEKYYSYGSTLNPITLAPIEVTGGKTKGKASMILYGLLLGVAFIAVAFAIMQFLVPWLQYKLFLKKYVKKFKPSTGKKEGEDLVLQQCYYCKDNFQEGDTIVTKCKHTVHWECWEENHDRCPEYGLNSCKEGIYFYNRKNLMDERNSPYFTSWLLYGLVGGLISWILFKLIPSEGFLSHLLSWIVGMFEGDNAPLVVNEYLQKIEPLLLCGLILGFVITFLFSYLIEFRKKTWKTILLIAARALGNAVIGCMAFLLGAVVIIALHKPFNCWWIDWVPWLFFGISITWLLSQKTDIEFKEAFLGGLISAVLSFVAVYGLGSSVPTVGALAFMIYAAGLGASIAVVHFTSENYYLHIEGPTKERDIAIYKWMNVAGGSNHVTIGRSPNCVIEMNWDKSDQIRDKQVELYIDNEYPYCLALTEGTTYGNENRALKEGDSILLTHGSTFTIGNTKFTYIEKDK